MGVTLTQSAARHVASQLASRGKGLGTALLVHSLHVLHKEGMEGAHLNADAENLTGAMRLYERAGFRIRKTYISYRKSLRGNGDS